MGAVVLSATDMGDLLKAVQALSHPRDLDVVMAQVCGTARQLTGADGSTFVLRHADRVFYAEENAPSPLWKGCEFPQSECLSGWSVTKHATILVQDVYADPKIPVEAYRGTFVRALAIAPVRGDDPLGALGVYWAQPHLATASEVFVLEALATAAAGAVANAKLRGELSEANRAKDEFLAILGHELRNPLAPIVTALHLLRLRRICAGERELDVIDRQVRHLMRLVDDLLDVSRIARGRVELKLEPVDVAATIGQAIEMVSPLLDERKNHLHVSVPPDPVEVLGDATRLAQVIANLLTNAAKYSEPGGKISITAESNEQSVKVRVRDEGIGIASDILPRVFDPFVQDRQSLDRSRGGLGLGLAIAHGLVKSHGGTLEAFSEGVGRGAELEVTLPAHTAPSSQVTRPRGPSDEVAENGKRRRVLVVDDNEDAAEMLGAAVELAGYEVAIAHDAPTALAVARDFGPDIALLDVGLPVMDGYELGARLRELNASDDLRLVAVTGYGQASDRERSSKAGFHEHLVKPIDMPKLFAALRAMETQPPKPA